MFSETPSPSALKISPQGPDLRLHCQGKKCFMFVNLSENVIEKVAVYTLFYHTPPRLYSCIEPSYKVGVSCVNLSMCILNSTTMANS
jgi:hypothetical protein